MEDLIGDSVVMCLDVKEILYSNISWEDMAEDGTMVVDVQTDEPITSFETTGWLWEKLCECLGTKNVVRITADPAQKEYGLRFEFKIVDPKAVMSYSYHIE